MKKKHETGPLSAPDGLNLTPIGNADRFLRDHGDDLRWVQGTSINSAGTFFHWNGMRWQENNPKAIELAQQTTRNLKQLIKLAIDKNHPREELPELLRFWKTSEADYRVREILSLAKTHIVIGRELFDANPDLLGVLNGVVDLRDGSFRGAVKEDLLTKQCAVSFDPEAQCPRWKKFLNETTDGSAALVRYLQQCIGITLSGSQKEHLFFIIVGPAATGKSTFHETLQYMFGDYSCSIDPNSLAANKAEGGKARPDIAKLPGMRFVLANESRAGLRLDEGLIKSLTGADTFCARQLYQAEFDFTPTFKLWLRTNAEPQFDGADTGMIRRIKKVPFVHVLSESARDRNLPEKLRQEAAGILNWALAGLRDYQENGLLEPAVVRQETAEYIKSLDVIGQFIDERCEVDPSCRIKASELYLEYAGWLSSKYAVSEARFKSDLVGRGFTHKHTEKGNVWLGIRIASIAPMRAMEHAIEA